MASLPIRYQLPAVDEMLEAIDWYAARSEQAAKNFSTAVRATIDDISQSPKLWSLGREGCRQAPVLQYPYRIIYREKSGVLEIIAIAHTSRKPGYWRKRVR